MESGNNQTIQLCRICKGPLEEPEPVKPDGAIVVPDKWSWEEWKEYKQRYDPDNPDKNLGFEEWDKRRAIGNEWSKKHSEWKRIKEKHEECERRYDKLFQSHVPQRFWWSSPLTPTEGNKQAIEVIRRRIRNNEKSKGLFLYGDIGVGKTHLLTLYARHLILKEGDDVVWWDTARLFITLKNNFGKRYEEDEENEIESIIRKAIRTHWLFLDDLGREKSSDWTHETLFHIVNSRYEEERNTIVIVSNHSPSQLAERISDQIVSRLIEMCEEPIKISGEDWRLKKAGGEENNPQSPAEKI